MIQQFSYRRFLVALASLVFLAGCATSPEDGERWQEAQRPVLKARAEARWEALMQRDFDRAYGFLSPSHRAVVSVQQYRGNFGGAADWREVSIKDIRYDSTIAASINVEIAYRTYLPGVRNGQFENRKVLVEKWIHSDGTWWYTDQ